MAFCIGRLSTIYRIPTFRNSDAQMQAWDGNLDILTFPNFCSCICVRDICFQLVDGNAEFGAVLKCLCERDWNVVSLATILAARLQYQGFDHIIFSCAALIEIDTTLVVNSLPFWT